MEAIAAGLALGFAAGVSPGPLLTLVITSTLERGLGAGLRVSIAPLLTDAPIIALSLLVLSELPPALLSGFSLVGGAVVIWIGVGTLRAARRGPELEDAGSGSGDVWRGVLVNLLSPHPWLFWASVGGPLLLTSWRTAPWRGIGFLAAFYGLIVGSKAVVAVITARGRRLLGGAGYRRLLTAAGVLLIVLGLLLVRQGLG